MQEALYQSASDGTPFVQCLQQQSVLPGVKVDEARAHTYLASNTASHKTSASATCSAATCSRPPPAPTALLHGFSGSCKLSSVRWRDTEHPDPRSLSAGPGALRRVGGRDRDPRPGWPGGALRAIPHGRRALRQVARRAAHRRRARALARGRAAQRGAAGRVCCGVPGAPRCAGA